ncbi:MAG: hypothetical protein GKR90_21915 [Pseudomonadales bacterium]|nr:hypothetical protein [Pseudomonadales bacterium]
MNKTRFLSQIGIVLVIGLVLSGCSIKLAYNNVDRLVKWGVSDYVDLNREQKQVLNREIERVHYWHRINHLPLYADFTKGLAVTLTDSVSVDEMQTVFDHISGWVDEMEGEITPVVIDMMVSLTDEQVAALPEKLEKSNVETAEPEDGVDLADAQSLWAEDVQDGLRQFVGRLNKEQKAYIDRRALGYEPERLLWADYRRRFQAAMMALLETRSDRAKFEIGYRDLIAKRESFYGPELDRIFKANQRLNLEVVVQLLSMLTDRQSARFAAELTELSEDFAELAAEAEDMTPPDRS